MFTFLFQSYHGEISLCLHYFLSSSLLCQINIPAALFSEVAWQCCYKEFKAFLIGKNPVFFIFLFNPNRLIMYLLFFAFQFFPFWFLLCTLELWPICSPLNAPFIQWRLTGLSTGQTKNNLMPFSLWISFW